MHFKNKIVLKYTETRQQTKYSIHKGSDSDSKQLFSSMDVNTTLILLNLRQCKSRSESGLKVYIYWELVIYWIIGWAGHPIIHTN